MDSIETEVARQDERIKAIRDELRAGFDRLVDALKEHAEDDHENFKRLDTLERSVVAAKASWKTAVGIATLASVVVQGLFAVFVYIKPPH